MSAAPFALLLCLGVQAPAPDAPAPSSSDDSSQGDGENPWPAGPEAPAPEQPLPYPEAPREPGAVSQQIGPPPVPPEAVRPILEDGVDDGVPGDADPRLVTHRTRADLLAGPASGALDLDTALVDVPGLWLRHEQAGATRMLLRGLDERALAVTLDDVPLFDLGGLNPVLEQVTPSSIATLDLHHGARALSPSRAGAAGVLELRTLEGLRDQGDVVRLQGLLGGGYGGADLEKGVFTALETGVRRVRVAVHGTLLNREDQRLGRGGPLTPGIEAGGLLVRSGGSGGAVGARVDVMPMRGQRLFTTWHSARAVEVPRPPECSVSDANGRPLDCTRTLERGVDAWIVGGDQAVGLLGASVVIRGRAHMQHGVAREERGGVGLGVIETAVDDGVRAGARASVETTLPAIALGDVWVPRAMVGADVFADRFSSKYFTRSTRAADAEVPGLGREDPARARLEDGAVDSFSALSLRLVADGAHATLWAGAQSIAGGALLPSAELGARARLVDGVHAWVTGVGREDDGTLEGGLRVARTWFDLEGALWGSARPTTTAWGTELRGALRPALQGLEARATLAAVAVDAGELFDERTPASGVVNPMGTVLVSYRPVVADLPAKPGFFVRARGLLPQQRLSPAEEASPALCPERPSDEERAAGLVQQQPCSGAGGAFLLDVGAHLEIGRIRFDAVAENLLDQQGALRDEPIGFGGTSVRGLLTIGI